MCPTLKAIIHTFFILTQSSGNVRPLSDSHIFLNIFQSFSWSSSGMIIL